jgi:SNF2 family DNA or RNA helicase
MRGTVSIERDGRRIVARIPYANGDGPVYAKRVPGARWAPSTKTWNYPLDWSVCLKLRAVFGDALEIGPELAEWARGEKERTAELVDLSRRDSVELENLPRLAPELYAALRPYQTIGVKYLVSAQASLLADEPRLGKTIQALAAVVENNRPGLYLVSAPATTLETVWARQIARWLPGLGAAFAAVGVRAKREETISAAFEYSIKYPDSFTFILANPAMLRIRKTEKSGEVQLLPPDYPALHDPALFEGMICDESQEVLIGPNTLKMSANRQGMVHLAKLNPTAFRFCLTGTPARGNNQNYWGTFNWLRPDLYASKWFWIKQYWDVIEGGYGLEIGEQLPGVEEALEAELSRMMLRRTTAEVRPELPARMYGGEPLDPSDPSSPVAVWLPMEGKQKTAYERFAKSATIDLGSGELSANGVLAEMTRAKQFANHHLDTNGEDVWAELPSNKVDYLLGALEERGIRSPAESPEGDSKIVIASQSTKTLDLLSHTLSQMAGIPHLVLTGAVPNKDRAWIIEEFQTVPAARVLLLQTKTGGVGIELNAADEIFIIDETWIPDDQVQLEFRIDNTTGEARAKTVWYLHSLGTIEEGIARTTSMRDKDTRSWLDERRGVEVVRALLSGRKAD